MASKLPQLFQALTPGDWAKVRDAAARLNPAFQGEPVFVSVLVSPGFIDVGKAPKGQAYVGGLSMDAQGGGELAYRKVPVMLWPKGSASSSAEASKVKRVVMPGAADRIAREGRSVWVVTAYYEGGGANTETSRTERAALARARELAASSRVGSVEVYEDV